jgi:hypothetical protein
MVIDTIQLKSWPKTWNDKLSSKDWDGDLLESGDRNSFLIRNEG